MLIVQTNKAKYEYDIHSLVKAFYPEQEVKVLTPESVIKDRKIKEIEPMMEIVFSGSEVLLKIRNEAGKYSLHNNKDFAVGSDDADYETIQKDEQRQAEEGWHVYTWTIPDRLSDSDYKNAFKRFLYTSLREETGVSLPWGNLTGIRPTKIAMTMMEQGKREKEIAAYLREEHLVSKEKTRLGIEIAKREKSLLDQLHYEDGYSLYIGIPFCPTTCLYCSFTSFPISVWKERVGEYLSALEKEIDYIAGAYRDRKLDTIYIGGGTPSALSAAELDRLLAKVRTAFDFTYVKELTVEAGRADSITRDKLQVLYRHGVTRISVNPQTMKQATLDFIGRRHTVEQVADAFRLAREVGFDNINMDIILGLPGETAADVQATVDAIKELEPDSLTVHSLAVKRASKLRGWIEQNGIAMINNTEEMMQIAAQGAADMGMFPYYLYRQKNMSGNFENVGYAGEGKYGIYNILIMEEKQTIVALGAGSITKKVYPDGRIERCENVKNVAEYIERIDEMIERKRKLLSDSTE
ncbi:MAG: coproporphyrinogen dehydrogenase HemZ [Lachnospiraceae bacterium]|nr:coproporphyrinogen dehydrogenase HemZ [Lachnospiraceae bacterium]